MMRALLFSLLALGLALGLSACGFTPMHQSGAGGAALNDVRVELDTGKYVSDNQAGFFLTQRLRDRIGTASETAPYTLRITPTYSRRRLGLTDSDVASRYDVTVRADWKLVESETGDTIESGRTSSVTTFGAASGPFGIITADNVGVEQASSQTADKLIRELAKALAAEK